MFNQTTLIGRLGKDPIIKHFNENSAIAEFPLATTEQYKDKEGKWVELTDWHNIKLPTKFLAERAEKFLRKGSLIFLQGKSRTRSFDDKDGQKRYITEVIADMFRMMDKKDDSAVPSPPQQQETTNQKNTETASKDSSNNSTHRAVTEDDLPF
jgi:single-strand DNA-binding protein